MRNKIKAFFRKVWFGAFTPETYTLCHDAIAENNIARLRALSIGFIAFSLLGTGLFLLFLNDYNSPLPYLLNAAILVVGVIGLFFRPAFLRRHDGLVAALAFSYLVLTFAYGFGLAHLEQGRVVTVHIFFILIPLIFTSKTYQKFIVPTAMLALYIAMCLFCPVIDNKAPNIVNGITFYFVGVAFASIISYYDSLQLVNALRLKETGRKVAGAMSTIIESRDEETGAHTLRTAMFVDQILEELLARGELESLLTPSYIQNVKQAAPLHDVGKIRVPDAILNKPARLTKEEFEIIKLHTTEGEKLLRTCLAGLEDPEFIRIACNIALYHHERIDGTGYPKGLRGEDIPFEARVMAVADVYEALISPRCYKSAYSVEEAIEIMKEGRGSQFDPVILDAFLATVDSSADRDPMD
ncbi:MAG: HD-GYP domain-containing protein [Candidatus Enteromonas sp.]|nr:HD-GYP domain-containing protein [Candidatus Enteromonas sp.]MDY6094437.1 HD-GYP domain-containing protein [Candidatus Enteromonas sp.]